MYYKTTPKLPNEPKFPLFQLKNEDCPKNKAKLNPIWHLIYLYTYIPTYLCFTKQSQFSFNWHSNANQIKIFARKSPWPATDSMTAAREH